MTEQPEFDQKYEQWKKSTRLTDEELAAKDLLHTPDDLASFDYLEKLGFPGQYPYTRGPYPTMYSGRFWTMRQYSGFATAKETNERFKFLLEKGQTGLSIAFDLPTQIGYDSDHPMARGEVGKTGVAIDSLADMEFLLDGIPLDKVSTSMTINSTAAVLLCLYIAVAEKQGVPPAKLRGTIQNDLLKEYMARGTYIYPPEQSMRLIVDLFEYCSKNVPNWNTISISGYHIREAGSTAVQEVAFTLADAIAYVEAAIKAGLDPNVFGQRLSFFFNSHNDFLEEVAKFRAARRLWARLMRERFGVTEPKALMLRFHTQTAGSTLTAQQPMNNAVRVAYQAMAAVLGGTQSLHTNSMDEALALPTEESVQLALRTQQVLAYETGVAGRIDPLAGSYLVESLTDKIEAEAEAYIRKIEETFGGMVEAIAAGYPQREIHEAAYQSQRAVEEKRQIIVGMNKYVAEEPPIPIMEVDPAKEQEQVAFLQSVKAKRDMGKVEETLEALRKAAKSTENVVPLILECVKVYCTLGEVSDVLREVWGEYSPPDVL